MFKVETFSGKTKVPYLHTPIEISYTGDLYLEGERITLDEFNNLTSLTIPSIEVLLIVSFQRLHWPPAYWKHIKPLQMVDGEVSPENLLLGLDGPVESLEFPGFYMIPYYTNYVISPKGILIKRSDGSEIQASQNPLDYYTFRMTGDDGATGNRLRHRILCLAFHTYPAEVEDLDVNHINGVPGNDWLDNLEWATRSANMEHAYLNGLRNDNKPVQVKDLNLNKTYIFPSCSAAGRVLGVTETTISNRAKTNGFKAYDGYQFRFHPCAEAWPKLRSDEGSYLATFPDGSMKRCSCNEAARLAGVTRTSLLRLLREGRDKGTTDILIERTST